ncbi:unnamed protein product [Heligmosomoides polygyrus]|uniref:COX6C domain-containing protein n=1 Tax=Heligmosomoides polygyrus TaxID=6339 RepID=A0A183FFM3_HELPZ|nr:unnamed protein product [Heligmosomoides polygyrus]
MAPPALMRGMIHSSGKKAIALAFISAVSAVVAFNVFYVMPRHEKYEEFFKTTTPTLELDTCMHTCPKDLAKMYKEKGNEIAPL